MDDDRLRISILRSRSWKRTIEERHDEDEIVVEVESGQRAWCADGPAAENLMRLAAPPRAIPRPPARKK